jgi:hypothetical protein
MSCEWTKINYLKRYCGQTLEFTEDVADRNQDGLTGWRKTQGNWQADAQNRGYWRHLLEEVKAHLGL